MGEEAGGNNSQGKSSADDEVDQQRLESVLEKVADRRGGEVAEAVRLIVQRNVRSGRMRSVFAQVEGINLEDYVWRVADRYQNPGPYLVAEQGVRQRYLWEALFPSLQQWAYNWHLDRGLTTRNAVDRASACAKQAALLIARRPFPYDIEFDAWAITLLRQVCAGKNRPQ
jgi:hypothetical protein